MTTLQHVRSAFDALAESVSEYVSKDVVRLDELKALRRKLNTELYRRVYGGEEERLIERVHEINCRLGYLNNAITLLERNIARHGSHRS